MTNNNKLEITKVLCVVVENRAFVTISLAELLVEVRVGFAKSLGFLNEANKDGGDTSIHDFHSEEADRESDEESKDGYDPSRGRIAFAHDISNQTTSKTGEKTANDASHTQDHSSNVVVDHSFKSVFGEHVPR